MSIVEILIIGLCLSMDAVAVSMTNSMIYSADKEKFKAMPLFFGVFQAGMPLLGFYTGSFFSDFIDKYSGIISFLILGFIGGKMVYEAISSKDDEKKIAPVLTYKVLIVQAIATSIDAFAVGVTFVGKDFNIFFAVALIGITTVVCSILAILLGKKFGDMLEGKAEVFGGIVLILIGIKALLGI